jgi:hypothetical protein
MTGIFVPKKDFVYVCVCRHPVGVWNVSSIGKQGVTVYHHFSIQLRGKLVALNVYIKKEKSLKSVI